MTYPTWSYYPTNRLAPSWVHQLVELVADQAEVISTQTARSGLTSDVVLAALAPGLQAAGYTVETGKTFAEKIHRPVLFGENGVAAVSYEVDAVQDAEGVVLEVEAGRAARGNAAYRDLVRTSLILDARYLALLLPIAYRYQSSGRTTTVSVYRDALEQLRAVYASQRLRLPFEGMLLIGY
jgi:hypothetical protein